jgi:signal transduction histidine kinase
MSDNEPRTILVIDDSPPTCLYLQRLLERKGYRVAVAYDGETGTKRAMELLPDLILLDKELPGMHGFDVSRMLRRYHETSYIPILMISSEHELRDRIRGRDMGADDFIPKGIAAGELDSKIRAFLRIKDLQDELRRERDKLNQIFRFLHEPVVICDARDRIVLASQVFLNLFRLPREVAHFQTFEAILAAVAVPGEVIERLRSGTREEVKLEVVLDEEPVILTARSAPIVLEPGERAVAYIFQDITEKVADERMKADFHSMIAHDLRSPLSVIQGYISLMATGKAGVVNDVQQEFLDSITNKVTEIAALLNDFLDIGKIEAGFVNLKRRTVPLAEIVEEVVGDLALLAQDRHISISVDLPQPRPQVNADPLRAKQILTNLVSNAIKYNVEGGWIRIAAVSAEDRIRISVTDGGVGICDEELPHLFEPYRRGSGVRRIKGVGLGLVIVRKLVEAHGGEIEATSEPGRGSTFTFSLLRASGTADPVRSVPAEAPAG